MELIAFMGLVSALALASLWRKRFSHAAAFAVVACGLAVMPLISTQVDGVIAFAVWTLASYALLNFPKAAALYLASAFCYILELQGNWVFAIQVACNILGLVGLAAIWMGHPGVSIGLTLALFSGAVVLWILTLLKAVRDIRKHARMKDDGRTLASGGGTADRRGKSLDP